MPVPTPLAIPTMNRTVSSSAASNAPPNDGGECSVRTLFITIPQYMFQQ